ncbi:hypothetical protein D3C84_804460 [compost metagenome]
MQGLVGNLDACANQAAALDDVQATLLAEVLPAQGAALAVLTIEGGDCEAWIDKALSLAQFGTGGVQVNLFDIADAKAGLPVHQAAVGGHAVRFTGEQVIAVGQGWQGLFEVWRAIVAALCGYRLFAEVKQCTGANLRGESLGLLQSALQACLGQIGSGGVGFHTLEPDRQHGPFIAEEERRLGNVLAH